jgi:hypothetical protein
MNEDTLDQIAARARETAEKREEVLRRLIEAVEAGKVLAEQHGDLKAMAIVIAADDGSYHFAYCGDPYTTLGLLATLSETLQQRQVAAVEEAFGSGNA